MTYTDLDGAASNGAQGYLRVSHFGAKEVFSLYIMLAVALQFLCISNLEITENCLEESIGTNLHNN